MPSTAPSGAKSRFRSKTKAVGSDTNGAFIADAASAPSLLSRPFDDGGRLRACPGFPAGDRVRCCLPQLRDKERWSRLGDMDAIVAHARIVLDGAVGRSGGWVFSGSAR